MYDFRQYPDNVSIQGLIMTIDFWQIVEPYSTLPMGYIGRLYIKGQVHHLIKVGNATYDQRDINDAEINGYVARLAEYQTAYAAYQSGAHVENVAGEIVINGPPSLSVDKAQIENDGVEQVTVTCNLNDAGSTDEVRWRGTAPNGDLFPPGGPEVDNVVSGIDTWKVDTDQEGTHTVRVETDNFGWSEITFEGI
jgi:hypothetical protein